MADRRARGRGEVRPSAGPHLGPVRLTPALVTLAVAFVGASSLVIYAVFRRDESWVPLLATGMLALGIVFTAIAIAGAVGVYRSASEDRSGVAVLRAIVGGIAGMAAFGCFAAALVLGLLWRSPA
jgi:hypothetical protein